MTARRWIRWQVFDGVNWDDPELRPKVELHPVELDVPASGEVRCPPWDVTWDVPSSAHASFPAA